MQRPTWKVTPWSRGEPSTRLRLSNVRRVFLLAVLLSVCVIGSRPQTAAADEGWVIDSFNVVYDVQEDGTIQATETINADFGSLSKHGIFRYFNTRVSCAKPIAGAQQPIHPCPSGEYRSYDYDIQSVTKADGSKWKYDVSNNQGRVTVKIGDADVFVSGQQDYIIKYTVKGALDAYDDHDELYWDASGTWPVGMTVFTLTLNLPDGAESRAVCFEGFDGSNAQCQANADGSTITYQTTRDLSEQEQVTIVAGWQKGLVDVAPPVVSDKTSFRDFFTFDALEFGGVLGSAVLGILAVVGS